MSAISLEHTPFKMMSKDGENFVIGRSDTKEMICLGSFNDRFADVFTIDEFVFLQIEENGTVQQIHLDKEVEPIDIVKFNKDKAIIAGKIGSYWLCPYGFKVWAKKVFTSESQLHDKEKAG
jgi:hypothetical protein